MTDERREVQRMIAADPGVIFRVLSDPRGHVAIDSSGMLMEASGDPVTAVGDTFEIHMDREALNDRPPVGHIWGYSLKPADGGTLVTSYYDWSHIDPADKAMFPVVPESALRATLGILDRTVRRGGGGVGGGVGG